MKKWFLLLLMFFSAGSTVSAERNPPLYVFAAASLTDALQEISRNFEAVYDTEVFFNFAGSNTLRFQVEKGAVCDVFISADVHNVERLIGAGLVDPQQRHDLLENSLAVAALARNRLKIDSLADLVDVRASYISLADPETVPAGIYAKEALVNAGVWKELEGMIAPALDVRAALAQVENGNAIFGIVYKTDAALSPRVRIVYEIPKELHRNIVYPACIIKRTDHRQKAELFMEFLKTERARHIFSKYGFRVL